MGPSPNQPHLSVTEVAVYILASLDQQLSERVAQIVEPLAGEPEACKVPLEVAGHVATIDKLVVPNAHREPSPPIPIRPQRESAIGRV